MFDDEKLLKCKNALLVYKFRTNSKFSGLNLPETPDDTQGYHSSCYSKFTAVSSSQIKLAKEKQCNKNSESASAVQDSLSVPLIPLRIMLRFVDAETACATQSNSNTPALRKEHNGKNECLTSCSTENIQIGIMNDAIILDDEAIVRKIGNLESNLQFVSKEIKYHNSCRKKFASAAKSAVKKREEEHQSKWVLNKSIRENAMQKL
ncbi:hypothetical protein OUZ56_009029 [Daphnia magna]|uniref:Uncharacterized protein n=1 Tax=Daphnia magna TaxID=35525 RepID=A0ABR0AES7_9CRUS|nr:hypothetical protein OUZ56_009029 [Daphnia magna]